MAIATNTINAGAYQSALLSSFKNQLVDLGNGMLGGRWGGYATVTSTASTGISIITPSTSVGQASKANMIIPAGAYLTSIIVIPTGNLTISSASGKLRVATAFNAGTATLYAESAAASSGAYTAAEFSVKNITPVTLGGSEVTLKLFGTDGAATSSAATANVSATTDTKVIVTVSFVLFAGGLKANEFEEIPREISDNITSY